MTTLEYLNGVTATDFSAALDGIYEHSPWIVAKAAGKRPFASLAQLKLAFVEGRAS